MVFPTPVGVFLVAVSSSTFLSGLPHARGGVSPENSSSITGEASSPRPWGCFQHLGDASDSEVVFPTPVGVFPRVRSFVRLTLGLPHARGGVSISSTSVIPILRSSPRPWGCFHSFQRCIHCPYVFPTPVGVFLLTEIEKRLILGLPHARGGVSRLRDFYVPLTQSSPRPWGCFRYIVFKKGGGEVFPTPVGVFLCCNLHGVQFSSLPHARGGVSTVIDAQENQVKSSPRPWGCFRASIDILEILTVFPTPVGVFLCLLIRWA
ncbi:conserved hypothetical protein, secreted [methanotrophic bacterial endosymbiont of Bathymodiolus sp.]|nr:conserved hypothetical protein, secreted [methanotrophic bacterial endosymbiont of Bathymodiolus sp.]